jgi:hypothetical protein
MTAIPPDPTGQQPSGQQPYQPQPPFPAPPVQPPQYGQQQPQVPAYGQPQPFGAPGGSAFGNPALGNPVFGNPAFGVPLTAARAPMFGWIAVLAGVLAGAGVILPWFRPTIGGRDIDGTDTIHAWDDGKLGLVGPILLVAIGIGWLILLLKPTTDRAAVPKLLRTTILAGVLGLASPIIAWFLVPGNYEDWGDAKDYAASIGESLGRGPKLGFWFVIIAALIAVGVGIAGVLISRNAPAVPSMTMPPPPYGQPAYGQPQAPQFPQAAQYPQAPQYPQAGQYPQAPQYPQPTQYGEQPPQS